MPRLLLFLFLLPCFGHAQFYDRNWVLGDSCVGITFQNDTTIVPFTFHSTVNAIFTITSISDPQGNLLFFTNGITVYDMNGDTMDSGTRMVDSIYNQAENYGQNEPQGVIILPKEGSQYYLFYYSITDLQYINNGSLYPDMLYSAVIDMSLNGGKGKVISKQNFVYVGFQGDGRLTACRHANGRDWWLVNHGYENNAYHVFLVTPNGVIGQPIQHIGPAELEPDAFGQAVFSPDGSKYVSATISNPIVILDFDRCTGIFSNPDSIVVPTDTLLPGPPPVLDGAGAHGLAFSPDGRYLYACNIFHLNQYDMQAANIAGSAVRIYTSLYTNNFYGFKNIFLAPNGQIICANFQGFNHYFYSIQKPNLLGTACNFDVHAILVPTHNTDVIPNMPNYRLGALIGSSCDTLHTGINDLETGKNGLRVYPNPATDYISISLLQYHKSAKLSIYDALGKEVYRNENMYLDDTIDVRKFSSGIYLIKVSSDDGDLTGRFVKE